jgi:hypothetical protein
MGGAMVGSPLEAKRKWRLIRLARGVTAATSKAVLGAL